MMTAASQQPLPHVDEEEDEMLVFLKHDTADTSVNAGIIRVREEVEETKSITTDHTITDAGKLSYEIFSILESKFLFGYDDLPPPKLHHFQHPPPPQPFPFHTQRGKVCILSVDGGAAMRGLISSKVLAFLEKSLQTKSGDPDARLADFFDIAAGTGVGGLFSTMLFTSSSSSSSDDDQDNNSSRRPLYRSDEISRFLADNAPSLFPRRRRRSPFISCVGSGGRIAAATSAADRAFKNAFGESLTLRDAMKPLLIPCYDLVTGAPLVFSRADAVESSGYDFRLWEVVRATWAEPGRFEPAEMTSVDGTMTCVGIDGGIAMSNPAAVAVTHVLHNKHEFPFVRGVEDVLLLSIGCGAGGGSGAATVTEGSRRGLRRQWSSAGEWGRPVARIASDGAAELVDHAVALAFGHARESNYVRIQANASTMGKCGPNTDYDPSPENVKLLLSVAEDMLKQKNVESVMFGGKRIAEQTNMEKLDWFAGEVVREHQRRSCQMARTVAFKQPPPKAK